MLKVFHLKEEKVKLFERLIGIKYNMEYLKLMALEAQDIITHVEHGLQVSNDKIELLEKKVCEFLLGLILAFGVKSLWFHYWNSFRVSGFAMIRVVTCCLKSCWWKCQFVSCNSMFTMRGFIVIIRVLTCCLESLCWWKCWFVVRCKPYKARFSWLLLLKAKWHLKMHKLT